MRVLLTGASGNLGRGVLSSLVGHGHEVIATGRNRPRLSEVCAPFGGSVEIAVCDLSAPGELNLPADYDAVVHAAAHATAKESADDHVTHNVIGTRQLLRHTARSRRLRPFIFFSSLSVYGTIHDPVVDEQTDIHNPGSYGASKLLGELMLKEYGERFASVAIRLPGVLGPGARDPWLARVLQAAQGGERVSIYEPETAFNNALLTGELGDFICKLLTSARPGFDVLTLAATAAKPLGEVVDTLLKACESKSPVQVVKAPRTPFTISIRKAQDKYGFSPSTVLETVRTFATQTAHARADPSPCHASSL